MILILMHVLLIIYRTIIILSLIDISFYYLLFSISNENENAMDNLKLWKFKLLKKSVFWTDLNVLVTLNPHDKHAACKIWQIELKKIISKRKSITKKFLISKLKIYLQSNSKHPNKKIYKFFISVK